MSQLESFTQLILALMLVVASAHICGWLLQKMGQPKVVGEMLAGILLGPSLLGALAPTVQLAIFSPEVKNALYTLSNIGLAFYMFLIGCELDHTHCEQRALSRAGWLSLSGVIPGIVFGGIAGYYLHGMLHLTHLTPGEFGFFLGAALSVTAFPTLARILEETRLVHSTLGSLTLVAASIDDALAWCLLAVVTIMARAGSWSDGLYPLLGGVVFVAFCYMVIRPAMRHLGARISERGKIGSGELALIIVLLLGAMWFTDKVGIYSVFGSFVLGMAMPRQTGFQQAIQQQLHGMTTVFLLPMFFAYSGLNTQLLQLFQLHLLIPFLIIFAVANLVKYGSCTLAMRGMGFSWGESSAVGGLFNARGMMLLIFVNLGMANHLIDMNIFSMLVITALLTTATAMPIFRASFLSKKKEARSVVFDDENIPLGI